MFDNVLYQDVCNLLKEDIRQNRLPSSILFNGPAASGKLSCALELARVLSCQGTDKGKWTCTCPSCLKNKALVSTNVLVVGPGNRTLEISASKNTFLEQVLNNTNHLSSSRYLFIRAVRKLTVRFSDVLWEDDDKLTKFAPLLQSINDNLEKIEVGRELPEDDELTDIVNEIEKTCIKLENSFLYDAIPVSQIRRFSSWARLTSAEGKKVIIIENAESMAESARNALLKILEEPPEDIRFILTTTSRGSVMPTILSRVRTYNFTRRSTEQQREVISRVYHYKSRSASMPETIDEFLQEYLSVSPAVVKDYAAQYFKSVCNGKVPDVAKIVAGCDGFDPRILLKIFLKEIIMETRCLLSSGQGSESVALLTKLVRDTYNNVSIYNQSPLAALEEMSRTVMQINHFNGGVFRQLYEDSSVKISPENSL